VRQLPNAISVTRGLSAVIVVALIALGAPAAALAVFALAALTDAADGLLARRLGAVSPLGTFLDPLADKVLVLGSLGGLLAHGDVPALPVVAILVRAVTVTGLRALAASRAVIVPSNALGKAKAVIEGAAVAAQLAVLAWPALALAAAADALLWFAAAVTVVTGIEVAQRASAALAAPAVRAHAR
jgi:CDP-diacylglycerol--glycerol-3-phosphate 3-phosphatidyltransferase